MGYTPARPKKTRQGKSSNTKLSSSSRNGAKKAYRGGQMRPETRKSMEMLFTAKWNLPKAAVHCGLTNKEMKITFNEYRTFHPSTYNIDEETLYVSRDTELALIEALTYRIQMMEYDWDPKDTCFCAYHRLFRNCCSTVGTLAL